MNEDAIDRKLVCAFIDGLISDDVERKKALEYINELPPVTPQEPKTGHWIGVNGDPSHLQDGMTTESVWCSVCGKWLTASDEYSCDGKYCPNCGAKMEVEE